MQSCYQATKLEVVAILDTLLRMKELITENAETAMKALKIFAGSKTDFSDCLIERSANKASCIYCVSFDANAVEAAGFRLLWSLFSA